MQGTIRRKALKLLPVKASERHTQRLWMGIWADPFNELANKPRPDVSVMTLQGFAGPWSISPPLEVTLGLQEASMVYTSAPALCPVLRVTHAGQRPRDAACSGQAAFF